MSTVVNVWGRRRPPAANAANPPVVDLVSPVKVNIDRPDRPSHQTQPTMMMSQMIEASSSTLHQIQPTMMMPQMIEASSSTVSVVEERADYRVTINVYCCCCGSSNSPSLTPMDCSPSAFEDGGNTVDFNPDHGKGKQKMIGHP